MIDMMAKQQTADGETARKRTKRDEEMEIAREQLMVHLDAGTIFKSRSA